MNFDPVNDTTVDDPGTVRYHTGIMPAEVQRDGDSKPAGLRIRVNKSKYKMALQGSGVYICHRVPMLPDDASTELARNSTMIMAQLTLRKFSMTLKIIFSPARTLQI